MREIVIREAGPADVSATVEIYLRFFREQNQMDEFAKLNPAFDARGFIHDCIVRGLNRIFIAEIDGKPVGFVRLLINHGPQLIPVRQSQEPFSAKLNVWRILNKIINIFQTPVAARMAKAPITKPFTYGYLADMYVVPEARGQGVGEKLMSRAREWFSEKDIKLVFLQVLEANQTGREFWNKMGFKPSKTIMVLDL